MEQSTLDEFMAMVNNLAKPGEDIVATLTPENAHLWHMATGVSGEVGEFAETIPAMTGIKPPDLKANQLEELGDIEFYLEGYRQGLEVNFKDRASIMLNSRDVRFLTHELHIEASNLLDATKKLAIYNKERNTDLLKLHLDRIHIILNTIYAAIGSSREEALKANLGKLLKGDKARYSKGHYSDEQAQERADKEG